MDFQSSMATWVSAVATLLAVLIALFKEEINRLWRRPKLRATIRLTGEWYPDEQKMFSDGIWNRGIRLRNTEAQDARKMADILVGSS